MTLLCQLEDLTACKSAIYRLVAGWMQHNSLFQCIVRQTPMHCVACTASDASSTTDVMPTGCCQPVLSLQQAQRSTALHPTQAERSAHQFAFLCDQLCLTFCVLDHAERARLALRCTQGAASSRTETASPKGDQQAVITWHTVGPDSQFPGARPACSKRCSKCNTTLAHECDTALDSHFEQLSGTQSDRHGNTLQRSHGAAQC